MEIGGGAEHQQVSKCKGRPSEKQNLVLSKESTPAKDTGTTVTRPRSQFNSEQSIESDNVSPPRVSFFALMDRGNTVDVIPAVVDGGEVEKSLDMRRTAQQKTESRFVERIHTCEGYWYYSDKNMIPV